MKKDLQVTVQAEVPSVPNFIRLSDGQTFPVHAFTVKDLKKIGKEWTEALIRKGTQLKIK